MNFTPVYVLIRKLSSVNFWVSTI